MSARLLIDSSVHAYFLAAEKEMKQEKNDKANISSYSRVMLV